MGDGPVVDRRRVEQVARLAHVTLDDEEKETLAVELVAVLSYVRTLEQLDVTGVEPTSHPIDLPTRLRDDETAPGLPIDRGLAGAPQRIGDSFAVPKVIE